MRTIARRLSGLALAAALLAAGPARALSVDSQEASGVGHAATTSPETWSFTNTAGNLLIVGVGYDLQFGGPGTLTIGAVSYGGNAMTAVPGSPFSTDSGNDQVALFYLVNPPTGANTVSVAWTSSAGTWDAIAGAISFAGANTASPVNTAVTNSTTSAVSTATVTDAATTAGNILLALFTAGSGMGTATAPTVLSAQKNVSQDSGGDNMSLAYTPITTGSTTASVAISQAADEFRAIATEVKAAPAAGCPALALLGVGC